MYCKRGDSHKVIAALSLMLLMVILCTLVAPNVSADDNPDRLAQADDVRVSPSVDHISIKAGQSTTIYLDAHNMLTQTDTDPNTLAVYFNFKDTDDISVDFPNGSRVQIDGGEIGYCEVKIHVNKYATSTEHIMTFDITINDPDRGSPIKAFDSDLISISVYSELSAGESYNKILGMWTNPLPAPLNDPLFTTVISLLVWISVAIIVAYFIIPFLYKYYENMKDKIIESRRHRHE